MPKHWAVELREHQQAQALALLKVLVLLDHMPPGTAVDEARAIVTAALRPSHA